MRADRGQFKILTLCQGFPLGGSSSQSEVMRGSRLTVSLLLPQEAAFSKPPPPAAKKYDRSGKKGTVANALCKNSVTPRQKRKNSIIPARLRKQSVQKRRKLRKVRKRAPRIVRFDEFKIIVLGIHQHPHNRAFPVPRVIGNLPVRRFRYRYFTPASANGAWSLQFPVEGAA